jgi:hypothetical protein
MKGDIRLKKKKATPCLTTYLFEHSLQEICTVSLHVTVGNEIVSQRLYNKWCLLQSLGKLQCLRRRCGYGTKKFSHSENELLWMGISRQTDAKTSCTNSFSNLVEQFYFSTEPLKQVHSLWITYLSFCGIKASENVLFTAQEKRLQ